METEAASRAGSAIKPLRRGAVRGLAAWLAYGAVEHFLAILLEGARHPEYVLPAGFWRLTLVLFGVYATAGLILGSASGIAAWFLTRKTGRLWGMDPEAIGAAGALLSLPAVFLANFVVRNPFSGRTVFACFACTGLMLALYKSLRSARWARRLKFVANPWTASLLLAGPLWAIYAVVPPHRIVALGLAVAVTAAILLASYLASRIFTNRRPSPAAALARAGIVAIALIAATLLVDRSLLPPRLKATGGLALAAGKPDVIWIVLDTVRADHLSVYGYARKTTPNLEHFAREATLYRNAISASDVTTSSHTAMFTGAYPTRHGAHYAPGFDFSRPFDGRLPTIAEILRSNGYLTAAVAANYGGLGTWANLNRGFGYYEVFRRMPFFGDTDFLLRLALQTPLSHLDPGDAVYRARDAGDVNRSVFRLLDDARAYRRPLFLFVNYMDAHNPVVPPAGFDTLFPGKDPSWGWPDSIWKIQPAIMSFRRNIRNSERLHLLSQYDGALAYLDSQLAALFARLKELGLYDNSLLIVTSDHGEAFGRRNLIGHAISVYQDQVHVPLIIKYPKQPAGAVVERFVSGVDLMPTVLDVVGSKTPAGIDGRSLLQPEAQDSRTVIAEIYPVERVRRIHKRFRGVRRAVFQPPMKLLVFPGERREMYDLARDPEERLNRYDAGKSQARVLRLKLDAWLKDLPPSPGKASQPDRRTLERLRSLGYIQ